MDGVFLTGLSHYAFAIATLCYTLSFILYSVFLFSKRKALGTAATITTSVGFAIQTTAFFARWAASHALGIGRVPLTNLYESLLFFTWSIVLIYLVVEYRYKIRSLGAFVLGIVFLALGFNMLAGIQTEIVGLMPALKSNWLFYHVLLCFLGYAAFGISFAVSMLSLLMDSQDRGRLTSGFAGLGILAFIIFLGYLMAGQGEVMKKAYWLGLGILILAWILFLILKGSHHRSQVFLLWSFAMTVAGGLVAVMAVELTVWFSHPATGSFKSHLFTTTFFHPFLPIKLLSWAFVLALFWLVWSQGIRIKNRMLAYLPSPDMLDSISYQMISLGWPLLTMGIITGSVWANTAWGSYWSWDPKETWSLITWFLYAIYLHARYMRGWKGTQMAVLSVAGFLAVLFTYLGVNLVLSGLHSYGGID
ncbi:MAG: cytochrome c biogenesis protein CcsA [Nitrospirota bacterium]